MKTQRLTLTSLALVTAVTTLLGPAAAEAAITVYTDRAAWEADAAAAGLVVGLETFDTFPDTFPDGNIPDITVGPVTFTGNDVGLTGSNGILGGEILSNFDIVFFRTDSTSVTPPGELRGLGFDHAVNTEMFDEIEVLVLAGDPFMDFVSEPTGSTFIGFLGDAGDLPSFFSFEAAPMGGWDSFDNLRVAYTPGTGACCIKGVCFDDVSAANCAAVDGNFFPGVACDGDTCSNDDCAGAIPIGDGDTPYSTLDATTDGPDLPAECQEGANPLDFGNDIWFTYLPTASGTLTVSTCDQADYDSRLAAYTGECGSLELIACNDDGPGCAGFTSLMEVPVVCGVPVLLRVGGFATSSGSGTLTLSLQESCGADVDGNGVVDFTDLLSVLASWGPCP